MGAEPSAFYPSQQRQQQVPRLTPPRAFVTLRAGLHFCQRCTLMNIKDYLEQKRVEVARFLDEVTPRAAMPPATLHDSMRYSFLGGGKRIRPILPIASAGALGTNPPGLMAAACSLELIHPYSLIHDDLPAMDNDDFRRGKPTNHKVYGEGIAVLAGDALLTQAFEIAARSKGWPRYSHQDIILEVAKASGSLQLIAGQVADLEAEGKKISEPELKYIHERKTSALLC